MAMHNMLEKFLLKGGWVLLFFIGSFVWAWLRYTKRTKKMVEAIEAGNAKLLRVEVQRLRSELQEDDFEMLTPFLELAVIQNQPECMKVLLELGDAARLQLRTKEEEDADLLSLAVEYSSPEMLRLLLSAGMRPEVEDGSPPWMRCCLKGDVASARVLAEFGADVMTPEQMEENSGLSALHAVVYGWYYNPTSSAAMARYLLEEHGDDVNACSPAGNTPMDLACDETHVGYEGNDELQRILKAAGGLRGRSLRVPQPAYAGRVFVAGGLPEYTHLCSELPAGVRVTPHEGAWKKGTLADELASTALGEDIVAGILTHTAYIEVSVQGEMWEDPIAVAERACSVLQRLSVLDGVVGLQFQHFYGRCFNEDDEGFNPLNLVELCPGKAEDGTCVIGTNGMTDYGLQEFEVVVPAEVVAGRNLSPFEPLYVLLKQAVDGTTALEVNHTLTLCGLFSTLDWGEHVSSRNTGFRVFLSAEETPESYLRVMDEPEA